MKRIHMSLHVRDLEAATAFYSKLFDHAPTMQQDDYVQWILDDPRLNLSITQGRPGLAHVGIQAENADEFTAVAAAFAATEGVLVDEGETTCCYARSEKRWLTDPAGLSWEGFLTHERLARFDLPAGERAAAGGGCCATASAEAPAVGAASRVEPAVAVGCCSLCG